MIDWLRKTITAFFGQRWVRFGMVGVAATLAYAVLALFFAYIKWPVLVGNTLAFVLAFFVSYFGHRIFTFHSKQSHRVVLPKFMATQGVGLGLNTGIIVVLMYVGLPYVMAMPVAIVAVPVVVYTISKLWVFRDPAVHVPTAPKGPATAVPSPSAPEVSPSSSLKE